MQENNQGATNFLDLWQQVVNELQAEQPKEECKKKKHKPTLKKYKA